MSKQMVTYVASLMICMAGCDIVSIDAPIGVPIDDTKQLALVGRWIDDDGKVVEIRRTRNGQLTSGWLTWDEESGEFSAETIPLDVRRVGDVFFYSSRKRIATCLRVFPETRTQKFF